MAIPGQPDLALGRFEDALFRELAHQHDRVDLFVSSKASEINRRLDHLATNIERFAVKSASDAENLSPLRRQRRFAKYERDLLQCDTDIHSLSRFCSAQVVAFRKILKKYKKWTGSTTLHTRINQDVLGNPKSFTRKQFGSLQTKHDEVLNELRAAEPPLSEPSSPDSLVGAPSMVSHTQRLPRAAIEAPYQQKYWNEYDDASDAGHDDGYAIYVNPNEEPSFPGYEYVAAPFRAVSAWFGKAPSDAPAPESAPLLTGGESSRAGYMSTSGHTDSEEDGYASSDGIPSYGFEAHYAVFPSVDEQRVAMYRKKTLFWGTIGSLIVSYALLGVCSILIATGKHRLHIEVDVGVTLGVVISLFCACAALGMMLYRNDRPSLIFRLVVWCAFMTSCILNGMLLVLVANNTS